MKIVVGIVLYNPSLEILNKSISEIEHIATNICLIDNCSDNIKEINQLLKKHPKIIIIKNKENLGIAKALNQLLEFANCQKSEFLLTLDQDSILKKEMLNYMLQYKNEKDVALICPVINDLNKENRKIQSEQVLDIERCITSGTLMKLKVCNKIGIFDEKMFIDYVDFDYCKRVILNKKRIIRVQNAIINHEIGRRTRHKFLFWTIYPTNHNPNRVYYYARNIKYYCKKFKHKMTLKEKIREYTYLSWKALSILLYEKNKKKKLSMFFKGIKDYKILFEE